MTLEVFLDRFAPLFAQGSILVFGIAILGGVVASTVCPCTLPVGIGIAGFAGGAETRSKRSGFLIALAFFIGIVVNLTILGGLAGRLGAVLTESFGRYWALGMAFVSLLAAVAAFWGPGLSVDRLISLRRPGIIGSFVYGFIFSLGTSAAPLLLLFTLAAAAARPEFGIPLAFAFGIGRGLPFLLVGLFAGALMRFAKLASWRRLTQMLSGSALVFVSIYYVRVFVALL